MSQTDMASNDKALFEAAPRIYPKKVRGTFRNIKWGLMVITLGVYYLLPFLRWDRGPGAPDQAVLVDLPGRRMYFFFIEIWPQEVYYLTGLLILAAMVLFLMNAIAGRIWCGYLCWQTVWTDMFMSVERWIEGDRRGMMKLDKEPLSLRKIRLKLSKHFIWMLISLFTGGAWVLYFADAPTLVNQLIHFKASFDAYLWIAILTGTTYLFAGWAREQVCVYMCPWPRIQAALTDDEALNVSYLVDRGEPRGSIKQQKQKLAKGLPAGDCIDCRQCVNVCPTGVDIRNGLQLPCIQCGLCIDACDAIMTKVGKPTGLITYESEVNLELRMEGKETKRPKIFRPRTLIYMFSLVLVTALMGWSYFSRSSSGMSVLHDRNPIYVNLSNGGVRNGYTVRLLNMKIEQRNFRLDVEGFKGLEMKVVGNKPDASGQYIIKLPKDSTLELRVLLSSPPGLKLAKSVPVVFRSTELESGEVSTVEDFFKSPGK